MSQSLGRWKRLRNEQGGKNATKKTSALLVPFGQGNVSRRNDYL
jgi:hypothetical protein